MNFKNYVRSSIAMVLLLAVLMGMVPPVFAAETDREQIIINAEDLVAMMDAEESSEQDYDPQIVCPELDELLGEEEEEDTEFGYLTNEERRELGLEERPETKDVRGPDYVFLDLKVASASRNFNWQVNTDSSSQQYFAANKQGLIAGYYQGDDPRLYMPVETHESGLKRLNSYVLNKTDIIQVRIAETSANKFFTDGGTGTYNSYFTIRTSNDADAWAGCGTTTIARHIKGQTLQFNVPDAQGGKTLYGVRWDPIQPTDAQKGKFTEATRIYVDYIYVGPAATAPVSVQFFDENSKGISQGFGYVGYGKKAPHWDHEKSDSETSSTQSIWGWSVHEQRNGTWTDIGKFITDPSTYTCKYNTRFYLKQVTVLKKVLNSEQTYSNGKSTEDDKYVLTVDGFDTAEASLSRYGSALDISIIVDRSGSHAELTSTKKLTSESAMNTYLDSLDKRKWPGYYRASCWRRNNNKGGSGGKAYVYHMPMRYYRGQWQMQVVKKSCDCNGTAHRDYGIVEWNSTGMKQCSHVGWVSMSDGFALYKSFCEAQGYSVSGVPFEIGPCRLGKTQNAIEGFLQDLYNSLPKLKPGTSHTVSVIGYGKTVFMANYPYDNGSGSYKTTNNYSACTKTSVKLDHTNYEAVLKAIRDTYVFGATRTDCALQVLTGTKSEMESNAGKGVTATKTDYLPNAASGRKRVVLLLTDGHPSSNLDFDNAVANKAIAAAKTLKSNSSTKIYTVGIMSGLDASKGYTSSWATGTNAQRSNNFLNLVSSAYKTASNITTPGSKTTDATYFFADTGAGSALGDAMTGVWNSTAPAITASEKSGAASLWLYEEFSREWKPDPDGVVKIYAAPHTGNGNFGTKVQIGEHKITSGATKQTYSGKGYKLHIEPFDDQRFACVLQWTDAKTAFLRNTELSTGSAATAMSGSLNVKKGYKVFMEIPIEVDRNNTLGGNNIPLTTAASGCYQANSASDTAKGAKLYNYTQPNANVFCSVGTEPHDYFISLEDYIALITGQGTDNLKSILDNMVRLPENLKPANDKGLSNLDYVSFDVKLSSSSGTVLYHKAADFNKTALKSDVYNIKDALADLATDQKFTMVAKLTNKTHNVDSYGREPYDDVNETSYPSYYVPKFAVTDFGDNISVPMGLEGQNSSKITNLSGGKINTTTNTMIFENGNKILNTTGATYTYETANTPKNASSNKIAREVHIIPANVVTYDDSVITFESTWKTLGTKTSIEQTFDNTTIYGYDPKYNTTGDFHGSVRYAEVDATNTAKQGTFTFTGTGFELLSRTTTDSGVLVAEIFSGTQVKEEALIKGILCNTYLSTGTHNQVPVIRWDADYGTYTVRVTALYNIAFALDSTKHPITDAQIREIMGYSEDVDMTYIPSQDRSATRAGIRPSYRGYVDGVRIFNPVQSSPLVDTIYAMAGESIADFVDMYNVVLDTTNWTGGQANGMLYLADKGSSTNSSATTNSNSGFPLLMEGTSKVTLEKVTVNGEERTYYLNASGKRYTYNGKEFWSMYQLNKDGTKGGYYYFIDNPKPTADKPYLTLTRDQVRSILGADATFYTSAYKSLAAKGEVQLVNGSGVAFVGNGDKVYLSVRSANGKACKVQVWDRATSKWIDYKDPKGATPLTNLTSVTEQFYDFSAYNKNGGIIIKNAGAGLLSIVHVKTSAATKGIRITKSLAIEACNAFETPIAETVCDELKLSHSLNLLSNISMNYIISKDAVADYDDYLLTAEVSGKSYILRGVEKGDLVYFTLDCLNAAQMNENITAQLKCYLEGETFVSPVDHYSIAAYAFTMLNKDNVSSAIKTLCANLLRYGSATQVYKNYATDALADEELSYVHRELLTDLGAVTFRDNYALLGDVEAPSVTWYGKTLSLDSTVAVKLVVNASDFDGEGNELCLRVSYVGADGQQKNVVLTTPELYNAEKKLYLFTLDCLEAAELRTVLTMAVYHGDTQVSQTMTYSADTYGIGKSGALLDVCKALFAYADAAQAVFAN